MGFVIKDTLHIDPYTIWAFFVYVTFAYLQIPRFHPKTQLMLSAIWRLHQPASFSQGTMHLVGQRLKIWGHFDQFFVF